MIQLIVRKLFQVHYSSYIALLKGKNDIVSYDDKSARGKKVLYLCNEGWEL